MFVTVGEHQSFKSFISQTTSTMLEHSSRNAEKSFVSIGQCFCKFFAAVEPSANDCVTRVTPCNDPSVYPTFCNKHVTQWYGYNCIEMWLWISSQAISVRFGATPGSHSRDPEVPRNPCWKTLILTCYSNFKIAVISFKLLLTMLSAVWWPLDRLQAQHSIV